MGMAIQRVDCLNLGIDPANQIVQNSSFGVLIRQFQADCFQDPDGYLARFAAGDLIYVCTRSFLDQIDYVPSLPGCGQAFFNNIFSVNLLAAP